VRELTERLWRAGCAQVYTVVVLQVAELPGNAYLNVFFLFLIEPASLALAAAAAERAGRRATLAGALLQGGAAVVLCGLTRGRAQLALAVASRVGVAGGLGLAQVLPWTPEPVSGLPGPSAVSLGLCIEAAAGLCSHMQNKSSGQRAPQVYSAELFPDTVRGAALNACHVAANLGGVAAPFLLWAGRAAGGRAHAHLLPLLVAGGLLTAAGAAAIALPETLGAPILLTIQVRAWAARPCKKMPVCVSYSQDDACVVKLHDPNQPGIPAMLRRLLAPQLRCLQHQAPCGLRASGHAKEAALGTTQGQWAM